MSDYSVCWHVRVHWRDAQGRSWETGGDVGFPRGTTWDEAIKEVLRMRSHDGSWIHRVEAEARGT